MTDSERITRQTRPTASFSLDLRHVNWLRTTGEATGTSASAILRRLLDAAMSDTGNTETGTTESAA